jgi:hypothetical protein
MLFYSDQFRSCLQLKEETSFSAEKKLKFLNTINKNTITKQNVSENTFLLLLIESFFVAF